MKIEMRKCVDDRFYCILKARPIEPKCKNNTH